MLNVEVMIKEEFVLKQNQQQAQLPQHQNKQPGLESLMNPKPKFVDSAYKGSGKLQGKTALITGGIAELEKLLLSHSLKKAQM